MKEKKYTFFESYHRALSRVSDARYGRVVRAMSNYVFEGQEPDFADDGDWIVWELVKPILDGMTNHNSSDNLLTVEEVSKKFKVNRITVWRWERDGLLHGKKMGRRKYYASSEIEKIINEQ